MCTTSLTFSTWVLGIKVRSLSLQDKHFTHWAVFPTYCFVFVYSKSKKIFFHPNFYKRGKISCLYGFFLFHIVDYEYSYFIQRLWVFVQETQDLRNLGCTKNVLSINIKWLPLSIYCPFFIKNLSLYSHVFLSSYLPTVTRANLHVQFYVVTLLLYYGRECSYGTCVHEHLAFSHLSAPQTFCC